MIVPDNRVFTEVDAIAAMTTWRLAVKLVDAGFTTVDLVMWASDDELLAIPLTRKQVRLIRERMR